MTKRMAFNTLGFTIIELLVGMLITGILAMMAFRFFNVTNQQAVTQVEISEMQQGNRACLDEICTALRSAGFGLSSPPAYLISGDSLSLFSRRDSVAIDTVSYFLAEFTETEYAERISGDIGGTKYHKLMKKVNSANADIFADNITDLRYTPISSNLIAVTLEVQTTKRDPNYQDNNGFRTFINTERAVLRNVK